MITKNFDKEFVFHADTLRCSFRLQAGEGRVLLYGKEAENGKTTFRLMLSFSREQVMELEEFVQILLETKTYPRMMAELAEEYFFNSPPRALQREFLEE